MCHIYLMKWLKYREHTPEILIGLLFSALLLVALVSPNNPAERLLDRAEMALYDLRIRLGEGFTPPETEPPILIVDIDEFSQQQEGRWPWPRERVAELIQRIGSQEPALIVLDILFGETEPLPITPSDASCHADFCPVDANRQLAAAIAQYDVVTGFLFHQEPITNGTLPPSNKPSPTTHIRTWQATGYATSIPLLQDASKAEGYMNTLLATDDGAARRIPLFLQYKGYLYPSLALATAQRFLLEKDWQAQTARIGEQTVYSGVQVGAKTIPTNASGEILIPYDTRHTPFPVISATDIMRNTGKYPANALEGAIVLIGTSALLQGDLKTTPIRANTPGVNIHAYALQGLLHPDILLQEPAWDLTLELLILLALSLFMLLVFPLCAPRTLLLLGSTLALLCIAANVWLWHGAHLRLDLIPTLLLILFITAVFVIYDLLHENRNRKRLQYLFGQYVPPEHIQQMLNQPQTLAFMGEKREMTVLFADLHDFTSIAERLDTQVLKNLLNRYLNAATDVIFQNNGTIDKYIGDMVMAFWNAPLPEPLHAKQAVLCALGLRQMLHERAADFRQFGITPLQLGIGINTGDMNVGDMGSDHRRAYTVLGDSVNLAARIESLTRFYGVDILVSEHTRKQCKGIVFRTIDRVRVKGKRETVLLFQPLGMSTALSPIAQDRWNTHERAMHYYWERDWQRAAKLFARLLILAPDDALAGMYLQRIATLMQQTPPTDPPTDWDGVYEHRWK
jgi:adenylate cyclase